MRISDWSSDVCSSDLCCLCRPGRHRYPYCGPSPPCARPECQPEIRLLPESRLNEGEYFLWPATWARELALSGAPYRSDTESIASRPGERDILSNRSEDRRVGKECVSTCSSRWSP